MANDKREQDYDEKFARFEQAARKVLNLPDGEALWAVKGETEVKFAFDCFNAGYAAATAEGIPQADGWVDVTVRLPEAKEGWNHSEQCLVWYQPSLDAVGNYGIAYYHYDPPYRPCEWVDFAHLGREPIAWMPLPKPYQRPSSEGE